MSFKDSKIAAAANSAMTLSAELAVDTEEYTLCTDGRYEVYTKYQDNAYSTVDNLKNIAVDATQINIMQEENSQYMPFRIPRYWDGMDLMDMLIQIRYESVAEKKGKVATVINVASNNTYIRFGWLIDAAVTANAGDIIFEIMATGVNEKGNNYIWRTKPNGKFTVLEGLNYDGIIEPSEDWYTSFVNMILGHVAEAKQYADEAKASAASINVDDIKADVKTSVMNDLNGTVTESLKAYYTKTEVDTKVKELNTAISGIDSLKNLKVEYDNTTGNLVFKDGTEPIGEPITINSLAKEVSSTTLNAIRIPEHSSTLVFGCSKADDGAYENFAKGTVHWAKVWYADLGEEQCMDIASWIHEIIPMEVAKFKGYYLSDVASKRANITFVASNLLGTEKPYNNKSTNAGGWADSTLNTWLNTRMVKAISPLWKALIKPVKVYSSVGNKSNDTSVSNCRFYVPSLYEVDPTATSEPYISETNAPIAYFTDDDTRKKAKPSTPAEYESYWTRSPNATVANWLYTVNESGATYGFSYPGQNSGILLMFSISSEG